MFALCLSAVSSCIIAHKDYRVIQKKNYHLKAMKVNNGEILKRPQNL